MARRRSNPVDAAKRRMPFLAKIRREDPFRREGEREIQTMCKRIAAASEYLSLAGWREGSG